MSLLYLFAFVLVIALMCAPLYWLALRIEAEARRPVRTDCPAGDTCRGHAPMARKG